LIALFITLSALPAYAQVEQGRFVGRITDQQGSVVPRADVKATNVNTNIIQQAATNASGEFVITPVTAGVYTLSVTRTRVPDDDHRDHRSAGRPDRP
jgi:hypothetical protein